MCSSNLLEGKVAIITGCSRGIGRAIMHTFALNGAIVYAVDITEGSIDITGLNKVTPCYFDITDSKAVLALVMRVKKEQGKIDILVNNAGVMLDAIIPMVTDQQILKTFEVNVFAMMHLIQYVSKVMKRQHSGSIINAASIMGIGGNYAQMVYAASKGAVIALTKSAAKELAQDGIRVNAVAPGTIDTTLLQNTPEETLNQIKSRIYMGKLGTPQEVANAYLFLASDLSAYISGQVLGVDGMQIN
jgi:3-oxoacyl-[acyl-carrier protein] reductase